MHASIFQGLLTLATLRETIDPSHKAAGGDAPQVDHTFSSISAMLIAVGLTALAAVILVLPSAIRRWRQSKEPAGAAPRRIRRHRRATPGEVPPAPSPEDEGPLVPVNFHHVPSAGLVSQRLRARARMKFGAPARPEDVDPQIRARLLQRKLAAHEEKIRSQQARMAWLEERLQTLNEELRTLRTLLHERRSDAPGQDERESWQVPLNRLDD
jgi:hypothetical protein